MALVEANLQEKKFLPRSEAADTSRIAIAVKNVLFATDFSATSEAALPYATAVCRHFGSILHCVHVVSDAPALMMCGGIDYISMGTIYEDANTEAHERLKQLSGQFEGFAHHNYVGHGQVWKCLAEVIAQKEIDLIVVGTHGRTGLGKLLLGSVAEDILRHAPCPVLTVGPRLSGRAKLPTLQSTGRDLAPVELELRQIVFATNFARNSALVAEEAVSLAEEFRARLTLLHVVEDFTKLADRPGPVEDGLRRLQEMIPKNVVLQYLPETLVEFGSASECILKVAADREADIIVLGGQGQAQVGGTHLPWSTAHQVIAQAHCPVLTVHV